MNPEQEFDRRIAAIHGLGNQRGDARVSAEAIPMDIRQAELDAMADVFLGESCDHAQREQLKELQLALHQTQAELARRHDRGELNNEQFMRAIQSALHEAFGKCEQVLGPENFRKLFGAPPQEALNLLDQRALFGEATAAPSS